MTSTRATSALSIRPVDVVQHLEEALGVEAAATGADVADFRGTVFRRHASGPGYAAYGAFDGDRLVGFTYGYEDRPGQWWHEQIATAMSAAGARALLDSHPFVVIELHVRPSHQGHGLGSALLRALCAAAAPRQKVVLSTKVGEHKARAMYEAYGFAAVLEPFTFASTTEPYAVLVADLPLHRPPASLPPVGR